MRVLVIDDMPEVRDIIAVVLREEGHDVVAAGDAVAAARALAADWYDAVICDVYLPKGRGLDVADAAFRRGIPVLLCTGDHLFADTLNSVGIPHLRKPFALAEPTAWVEDMSSPDRQLAFVVAAQIGFARLRVQMGQAKADAMRLRRLPRPPAPQHPLQPTF
jgi:DNA-binding response OmpR family regulator